MDFIVWLYTIFTLVYVVAIIVTISMRRYYSTSLDWAMWIYGLVVMLVGCAAQTLEFALPGNSTAAFRFAIMVIGLMPLPLVSLIRRGYMRRWWAAAGGACYLMALVLTFGLFVQQWEWLSAQAVFAVIATTVIALSGFVCYIVDVGVDPKPLQRSA